jgi:hypothetical protein
LDGGIQEEGCTGKKVNYSFFNTFDHEAFVYIGKENRTKLEEKSRKCSCIGYNVNDFRYRLCDYENNKIIRVEMSYSMRMSCTKISCKESNMKKKKVNKQCFMRS